MIMRVTLTVFAIAVAVLPIVMPAYAGGPNDDPPCVMPNPPGGATALRGTIAAGVQEATATAVFTDVDFTLRLERGGALGFFRASLNMQVSAISNEGILCQVLSTSTHPAAQALRNQIRSAFGFASNAQFFLVEKSLSKTEIQGDNAQWFCNNTWTNPTVTSPPSTCGPDGPTIPRGSAMADVLIYVK
jgi:hypothetical protein